MPPIGTERKFMTPYQSEILQKEFENNPFPEAEEQHQLAKLLNLSEIRIRSWYACRRSKKRKAGLPIEGEYTLTKVTRTRTQTCTQAHPHRQAHTHTNETSEQKNTHANTHNTRTGENACTNISNWLTMLNSKVGVDSIEYHKFQKNICYSCNFLSISNWNGTIYTTEFRHK